MAGNKINSYLDQTPKVICSLQTSNKMLLEVLRLVWIWLRPTLTESPICITYYDLYNRYKRLFKTIKGIKFSNNMDIAYEMSEIQECQEELNILRHSRTSHRVARYSIDPDEFEETLNSILISIQGYKEHIIYSEDTIRCITNQNISMKQDEDAFKILHALCTCCSGSQSAMFES